MEKDLLRIKRKAPYHISEEPCQCTEAQELGETTV